VDHLDRPILMADAARTIVWQARYRPFGEVVSITGAASNNLRFPGQYFLLEDGLHYNWHRHYDPTIGRYVQADPLEFVDGPSVYAYVKSRPTSLTDHLGLFAGTISIPFVRTCDTTRDPNENPFPVARKGPIQRCIICDAPHGGLRGPYCPDCYDKSLDPKGGIPPILPIPGTKKE
jgi:RHS repeat-associated protein